MVVSPVCRAFLAVVLVAFPLAACTNTSNTPNTPNTGVPAAAPKAPLTAPSATPTPAAPPASAVVTVTATKTLPKMPITGTSTAKVTAAVTTAAAAYDDAIEGLYAADNQDCALSIDSSGEVWVTISYKVVPRSGSGPTTIPVTITVVGGTDTDSNPAATVDGTVYRTHGLDVGALSAIKNTNVYLKAAIFAKGAGDANLGDNVALVGVFVSASDATLSPGDPIETACEFDA